MDAVDLAATQDQTGTVTLQLANLHGDVVATVDDSLTATGTSSYAESTEFAIARDPAGAYNDYGWLGTKQRSANALGGIILMGVRLYNPATGRFLSVDPVAGGNPNPYLYPCNPNDSTDLTGQWGIHIHYKKILKSLLVTHGSKSKRLQTT